MLLLFASMMPRGAWTQETTSLTLYDSGNDAANNSSAILGANGGECNVTLSGRTLYRDGNWNTLCLPFNMTATQIAASQLADATIKELDDTDSKLENGTLTLKFKDASTTVGNETYTIVAGKPYIVKWPADLTISSDSEWDTFVNNVAEGKTYAGKIVKLAADIFIGSGDMVGNNGAPFKGIFDGGGHTITCEITTEKTVQGAAPFYYIDGATIMNVKVTGSVTGDNHCAGLVGFALLNSTNTIKNCEVNVDVECIATGNDTYCGGILGHGHSTTTTISNCLYSGKITGNGSTKVGVIYGWTNNSNTGSHTIENCLANGTYSSYGTLDLMLRDGETASLTATNCYKNVNSGSKGTYFSSYSVSDLVTNLGSGWKNDNSKAVPKMAEISNIINPEFSGVTIDNTLSYVEFTNNENETNKCVFKGNYDPLTIDSNNRNEVLLLTSGNKLGYAKADATPTLNAFRAYFYIPVVNGGQAVRSFVLNFGDDEETGITDVDLKSTTRESGISNPLQRGWYTLDGRRLDRQPTKAGLYIVNGKKVFIK